MVDSNNLWLSLLGGGSGEGAGGGGGGAQYRSNTAKNIMNFFEILDSFQLFVTVVSYGYVFYRGLAHFAEIPI